MKADDVLRKYERRIEEELGNFKSEQANYSREYETFKQEMFPELSRYERLCLTFGQFIKLKLKKKDEQTIRRYIETAHLNIEPNQAIGFALFSFIVLFFAGILLSVAIFMITDNFPVLFLLLMLLSSAFVLYHACFILLSI